jgi:hypothetical protein
MAAGDNLGESNNNFLSFMPKELKKNMTPQEHADLIAYLSGGSTTTHPTTAVSK